MSNDHVRILIVDDHPIIHEGLPVLLRSYAEIVVVGTARDGEEGLAQLRLLQPDCVVIDMALPTMGGLEAIQLYLREKPNLGVVVYTGHKDEILVCQALQAGARAYVFKGAPISTLVKALLEVHRGGYWLSTELTPSIIKRYLSKNAGESDELTDYRKLTDREKQVFALLAKGRSLHEVGKELFISDKTVSKHQTAIKSKLKLKNTAEMAIYAMRIGAGPSM